MPHKQFMTPRNVSLNILTFVNNQPKSVCLLEFGESGVQVLMAKLWQSPSLHCRHQEACENAAPGVRFKF